MRDLVTLVWLVWLTELVSVGRSRIWIPEVVSIEVHQFGEKESSTMIDVR